MKKIVFGSDHAGYELKEQLKSYLAHSALDAESKTPHQMRGVGNVIAGYEIIDIGTNSTDSVDYPDFGKKAADAIATGQADLGVIICGSGIGISIAANRNPKVRAALCITVEMAQLSRQHNDANILALGARLTSAKDAESILAAFLNTEFEGGRHLKRVEKLS